MSAVFAFLSMLPLSVNAATKYLECTQAGGQGRVLHIHATLSDSSDKAEVQLYYDGAPCIKSNDCSTNIFNKDVLPTVMRLTKTEVGEIASSYIVDIDRSNLSVVTRSKERLFDKVTNDTFTGTCTVKILDAKSIL
jgi:hypothetical protein